MQPFFFFFFFFFEDLCVDAPSYTLMQLLWRARLSIPSRRRERQ